MLTQIPTTFFDMLPIPIAVTRDHEDQEQEHIVFINKAFSDVLGWTLEDIPTKAVWWGVAYPDIEYQSVIARQWELQLEYAKEIGQTYVSLKANVATKYRGEQRFDIYTQLDFPLIKDHWVVVFEPVKAPV